MNNEKKTHRLSTMQIDPVRRKVGYSIIRGGSSTGIQLGLRRFIRPHLSYRLGVFWVVLDPLLRALVFSFLMIVIRGNSTPESLVIGIFTLQSINTAFSTSVNIKLSEEPFPLCHTPTSTMILTKVTTDFFTSVFYGLVSSILLVLLVGSQLQLIPVMVASCLILAMLGCGIGFVISPYVTIVKDLGKLISYVLLLGLFLQCVLYPFSATEGIHRDVLSLMPHTICVEWCRSIGSTSSYPFSMTHAFLVIMTWSIPMIYGFIRFDRYRWRATTWS